MNGDVELVGLTGVGWLGGWSNKTALLALTPHLPDRLLKLLLQDIGTL